MNSDNHQAAVDSNQEHAIPAGSSEFETGFLSNRALGNTFLVLISILIVCILFAFIYFVVVSMASPSFLNEHLEKSSEIPAQMTVVLEYESRTMKTMGIQLAFGFLVGLVFAAFGLLLFAAGANGSIQMQGSGNWLPMTMSASAPGLAVMILGGIIICIAVSKDVGRDMSAEMNLPNSSKSNSKIESKVSSGLHTPDEPPRSESE